MLLTGATFCVALFCVLFVCSVSWVVLVRLSVPVQVIDWKDSSLRNDLQCADGDVKPYSLIHS